MNRVVVMALVLTGLFACSRSKLSSLADFKDLRDSDLVMRVMKIEDVHDTSIIKYGVKIFPGKKDLSALSEENKQSLWYQVDSSFYLVSGSKKYYAAMIEPIANGQKNSFEYLLMFEIAPDMNLTGLSLAFNDKYMSHKTHYLQLNAQ